MIPKLSSNIRACTTTIQHVPISHLPPRLLVPNHIHNLAIQLVFAIRKRRGIDYDIAAPLDPDGGAKLGFELGEDGFAVWELGVVEVVARGGGDARDEVAGGEGVGRRNRGVDCGEKVALWSGHACNLSSVFVLWW